MLYEISSNVAEAIPYRSFKDKIKIVSEELSKNRKVEVMVGERLIYSTARKNGGGKLNGTV